MRAALRQVFQFFSPCGTQVSYGSLIAFIGKEGLDTLTLLKLLVPTQRRQEAFCESCDDTHLLPVHTDESGKPFIACSQSTDRQYLNPDDMLAYSLNARRLLDLFLDAEGVEPSQMNIKGDGIFWELGSVELAQGAQHLFFICGLDELTEANVRYARSRNNVAILFLTDRERVAATIEAHTVPLLNLIDDVDSEGFELDEAAEETHFRRDYAVDNEKSIKLDEHIVLMLEKKKLLFQNKGLGQFAGTLSLPEPAVNMLVRLYNARHKNDPTESLEDLAHLFGSDHKQTISGYKKQMNDAAERYGTKEVIGKEGRGRYRLNPYLDCCK